MINAGDDAFDSYALFDGDEIDIDIKPGSDVDILSVFKTSRTGWSCASGYGFMTARLYTGQYISGADSIVTGCR